MECKLATAIDDQGNTIVILPNCLAYPLVTGKYCMDNFSDCFKSITDGGYINKVAIEVFTPTVDPVTGSEVVTSLIIAPGTEIIDTKPQRKWPGGLHNSVYTVNKAYVYKQTKFTSMISRAIRDYYDFNYLPFTQTSNNTILPHNKNITFVTGSEISQECGNIPFYYQHIYAKLHE